MARICLRVDVENNKCSNFRIMGATLGLANNAIPLAPGYMFKFINETEPIAS